MKVCERCTENNNCAWQNHEETICHDAPAFPMTNADRIRNMTDKELARFISCPENNDWRTICFKDDDCLTCRTKWLKQEVADADPV